MRAKNQASALISKPGKLIAVTSPLRAGLEKENRERSNRVTPSMQTRPNRSVHVKGSRGSTS